mgnify:CR=1 FL=1
MYGKLQKAQSVDAIDSLTNCGIKILSKIVVEVASFDKNGIKLGNF